MTKKNILFVDDEPNILSGIRRMLRSMRNDFSFFFAGSGAEALETMRETSVDIVVSDMRMPGMDGAELLTEVQTHYPHVVRIMLTGQADEESIIRTVSVVHQFLAKPCEPDILKEVMGRSAALHDLMTNSHLKEVIAGVGALPSLPSVYSELQEALQSPDVTTSDVAKIIEKDIAMTAKLLQLLNSSFFGLFQKVETPERAVTLLGLDTIKTLVLGVQVFAEMQPPPSSFSMEGLWDHSVLVANCSKKIAAEASEDVDLINNAFLAGMLHDIGRLLLVAKEGASYVPLIERSCNENGELFKLELETYSTSHCDVGAYLIGLWGFTGDIVEAVGFHNNLSAYPGDTFSAALAVHVADYFYYAVTGSKMIGTAPELDKKYIEQLGLSDNIAEWESLCRTIIVGSQNED